MARRIGPSDIVDSKRLVECKFVNVYRVDEHTVAKLCPPAQLVEAVAMQLVRSKTSVPVPRVYNAYVDDSTSRGVILMEYIHGDVLTDVWDKLDPCQRANIISQLRQFMDELHAIKGFGPYKTEEELNNGIVRALQLSISDTWVDRVGRMVKPIPSHEIVFSHADLSPQNIIVRGDKVLALLDWEMAGFYPAYWDYIKALYRPDWQIG
ncbi:hypothetical protein LOZ12_003625 [Ophidiomyces ophidiicola]|uniref:uncharacterized protein n=1 Tax=Ophidiomyces ophidiicola TaxID=1387563 RepID=UPI0020C314DD|nr:uncharacterized protein LOZ57_000358 [Ophidiomyces ophidiicola]KAI1948751.1 hypothetical protein LOZ62_002566 [Ophidiomyces ophidiicola]KAI1952250.1 hypothetical protein LOZ59_005467 [Ophidiomyces ophidiicola]KAI1954014.1 hypothetical protein LOZ57_000358 [Ophidiomyces ophidiicola]KAI1969245.1 hypothetical protein LOZ56_004602 [Ophidiomyces ophidiicola]KAI2004658.1 hypothetical protein LOZ50_004152 [Ophidiomyces ophidiicola]